MKKFLDRQIARMWMWLLSAGTRQDAPITCEPAPGDLDSLIQALISMNDVLARAVRS